MKQFYLILSLFLVVSCNTDTKVPKIKNPIKLKKISMKYGFDFNKFKVVNDTVENGESFGEIMNRHKVPFYKVNEIATKLKDTFDVRRIRAGKPYTILKSKDSLNETQVFIYKNNKITSTILNFKDSTLTGYTFKDVVTSKEKAVAGVITSNLSNVMDSLGVRQVITNEIANNIYAWTLDFKKVQKGDTFKIILDEKYIKDSVFVGYGAIKAVVINHKGQDLYAYRYLKDSINSVYEYYDEEANIMRRQFLKSPIKFQYRISSRYNLNRRIALYGNRVRPHKGTDFAAKVGTPIMSTANGTVIESTRRGGNGNFVKIKHNSVYSTQYLHMRKRNVRKGDYVKQGDIIGWVGMTGNTSGPHVCYRFWKNGRQVDPFKQKLPAAEPLPKNLKPQYFEYIATIKSRLDSLKPLKNQNLLQESPQIDSIID